MLGANSFSQRTEADEATSLELVIEPWLESIADQLRDEIGKLRVLPDQAVAQRLHEQQDLIEETKQTQQVNNQQAADVQEHVVKIYTGTVTEVKTLIDADEKQVFECSVEFARKLNADVIDAGSSIGVVPQNKAD